jgi:predicted ATP-dependent serine protease
MRGEYLMEADCNSSEGESILNNWMKEKCDNMELVVVNDIPILVEDCLSILTGTVAKVKNSTDKLIVTTIDNTNYVLESFTEMNITN